MVAIITGTVPRRTRSVDRARAAARAPSRTPAAVPAEQPPGPHGTDDVWQGTPERKSACAPRAPSNPKVSRSAGGRRRSDGSGHGRVGGAKATPRHCPPPPPPPQMSCGQWLLQTKPRAEAGADEPQDPHTQTKRLRPSAAWRTRQHPFSDWHDTPAPPRPGALFGRSHARPRRTKVPRHSPNIAHKSWATQPPPPPRCARDTPGPRLMTRATRPKVAEIVHLDNARLRKGMEQGRIRREQEGGGGLGPKSLCTKMARQDFPNGNFRFFPRWPTLVWRAGGGGSRGGNPPLLLRCTAGGRGGGGIQNRGLAVDQERCGHRGIGPPLLYHRTAAPRPRPQHTGPQWPASPTPMRHTGPQPPARQWAADQRGTPPLGPGHPPHIPMERHGKPQTGRSGAYPGGVGAEGTRRGRRRRAADGALCGQGGPLRSPTRGWGGGGVYDGSPKKSLRNVFPFPPKNTTGHPNSREECVWGGGGGLGG